MELPSSSGSDASGEVVIKAELPVAIQMLDEYGGGKVIAKHGFGRETRLLGTKMMSRTNGETIS